MIANNILKVDLIELAKLQVELNEKGGPPEDAELFEQILEFQENILNKFGLTISSDNEEFLFFVSLPTDLELENRIGQLHKAATEYLLSNAKSELRILKDAQEFNQSAYIVLPELKVTTHIYTCFVYDEILLKRKDSPENVLEDLKLVNNPKTLNQIGILANENIRNEKELFESLKNSGLKYIEQFVNFKDTVIDEKIEEHPFESFVPDNATILIIGSFPGIEQVKNKSNKEEWFYTAKDNQFWTILSAVYDEDLKTIVAKKNLFKRFGIGITDIFLRVRRKENSNLDKFLDVKEYNDKAIKSILENSKIKTIFFTSKYVEKHFKKLFFDVKNTRCLPSPSGAANIPISKTEDYKNYIKENPTGNTKTFRVFKYKELLKI